jgi:MraZ protein
MPDNGHNESIFYNSLFRHGVDDKRRVQIPARWRPADSEIEFTLILWPNGSEPDVCLHVLPPAEMQGLVQRLRSMPYADAKASALRRLLGSKSATIPLDKAGRLCIPDAMAKAVGIGSDAVLVGLVDRFEIWSPERYDKMSAADAVLLPEAFKLI